MGIHYITLIRHGQYDSTFGDAGGLNDTGRMQALMVGNALQGRAFDRVLTSPLHRARETANIVAGALDWSTVTVDKRLEECVPSIPRRMADWFARNRPHITPEITARGARQVQSFYGEMFISLDEMSLDFHTLIIGHGNVIRYLLSLAIDAGDNAWSNLLVFHCSISQVMIEPGSLPMLTAVNDLGHLPPEFHSER